MLRDFRVAGPELKYSTPSTWTVPSGRTCEVPSGFVVVSHDVWRLGPPLPGACV